MHFVKPKRKIKNFGPKKLRHKIKNYSPLYVGMDVDLFYLANFPYEFSQKIFMNFFKSVPCSLSILKTLEAIEKQGTTLLTH